VCPSLWCDDKTGQRGDNRDSMATVTRLPAAINSPRKQPTTAAEVGARASDK